jgi:6-pyruvoyltetrahydropterin 2'-reductase
MLTQPVTEIFYSLQGEGLFTGVPSIFIRFFGCNFKCRGFGMPKGELSDEYLKVDPSKYDSLRDLPLVSTGCDSYAAWDPRFKHMQKHMNVYEIVEEVERLTPKNTRPHIIFTGGEPLLKGRQEFILLLMNELMRDDVYNSKKQYFNFTFETNGTQELIEDWKGVLLQEHRSRTPNITFSVSAKLSSSGEERKNAIVPSAVKSYYIRHSYADIKIFFKFVVSHPSDFDEIDDVLDIYERHPVIYDDVYVMPVGGVNDVYEANWKWVAQKCLEKGYCFSQRLQVPLFRNAWGT